MLTPIPPPVPPAVPIVFDYTAWAALLPSMAGVDETDATLYFGLAQMYISNAGWPVRDPTFLQYLLFLTTAHIAFLLSPRLNGVPTSGGTEPAPAQVVGRINSATEGSVSVSTEMAATTANSAWWLQTQFGAMVWQLLKPFRLMRYAPPIRRIYNPPVWRYGGGYGGSGIY